MELRKNEEEKKGKERMGERERKQLKEEHQ